MTWGDEGETGDHIVPFRVKSEQLNRKEQSEESKTVKQAEQKISGTEFGLHDSKPGSSSGHNVDKGIPQPDFCMSLWPDLSLSNAREADRDSSVTEISKCLSEPAIYNSAREKTSELGKGPDIFHSTDESKGQGDFDEYDWANIRSFDDLDRIFSNDVPTFGDGSLSAAAELWSSCKDISNSPSKSLPSILDSQDLGLHIRTEFDKQDDHQFPSTGRGNGSSSQCVPNVWVTLKSEQYHQGQPSVEDQPYQQNKMMKFSKMSGSSETGPFQDMYGQRNPFRNSQSSLMAINFQNETQGSGTLHYPHMPNQYMDASAFGNLTSPYSTAPVLSTVENQLMYPSYYRTTASSVNIATDPSARLSTMTPQEKLDKLRRRQQMQAMLAIQRQQQQYRHQVPVPDQSITQNCPQNNPFLMLTAMPSFDHNSSLERNDCGNLATASDNSSEFSALYRLQDIVAKLDMKTRTCIRDSLFRLASSAAQRHHTSETAHSNKTSQDEQEVIPKEASRYKYGGMPDTETVTNPTDRTVAHLLFHTHMKGPEKGSFPNCRTRESRIKKQKAEE